MNTQSIISKYKSANIDTKIPSHVDIIRNDISKIISPYQLDDHPTMMCRNMVYDPNLGKKVMCESRKILSYDKQTRSADEGTTTFFVCTICGGTTKKN